MEVTPIESGEVTVSIDGSVVTITINRPSKRNALTQAMYAVISDTLAAADASPDPKVVLVTGNGVAFCAGNDLADFSPGGSLDEVDRFLRTIASVRVPVVAAVNGMAVGVGVTMLLHFDLVLAEPDAKLSLPFVNLGLVPEAASSLLLPLAIGSRRASELLLTGRVIDGTEAAAWGLVTAVASPVLTAATEAAHRLAAQPPRALRATKGLLRSGDPTIEGRMLEEMRHFHDALGGPEFAEVVAARSEGRTPTFS